MLGRRYPENHYSASEFGINNERERTGTIEDHGGRKRGGADAGGGWIDGSVLSAEQKHLATLSGRWGCRFDTMGCAASPARVASPRRCRGKSFRCAPRNVTRGSVLRQPKNFSEVHLPPRVGYQGGVQTPIAIRYAIVTARRSSRVVSVAACCASVRSGASRSQFFSRSCWRACAPSPVAAAEILKATSNE